MWVRNGVWVEERRDGEVGGMGVVRNEAHGVGMLGRVEERRDREVGGLGMVRNEAHGVSMSGRVEEEIDVEVEGSEMRRMSLACWKEERRE